MRSLAELICVDPNRVAEVWPHVAPLLSKATERCGDWTLPDIAAALDKGGLLWIVWSGQEISAAAVTRLLHTKHGLICHALACGGSGEQWAIHMAEIEQYAKDEGCASMRVEGREGWRRVFKDYDLAWITLEKRIN